jgi:hypothetical protein
MLMMTSQMHSRRRQLHSPQLPLLRLASQCLLLAAASHRLPQAQARQPTLCPLPAAIRGLAGPAHRKTLQGRPLPRLPSRQQQLLTQQQASSSRAVCSLQRHLCQMQVSSNSSSQAWGMSVCRLLLLGCPQAASQLPLPARAVLQLCLIWLSSRCRHLPLRQ